jgi:hypothetical protein
MHSRSLMNRVTKNHHPHHSKNLHKQSICYSGTGKSKSNISIPMFSALKKNQIQGYTNNKNVVSQIQKKGSSKQNVQQNEDSNHRGNR